jgi:hypothetical protein
MFDYAHIVAIEDHLRTRFPRGRVVSSVGTFERWGDAHEFRVESERRCYRLIVSHRFLAARTPEPVSRLRELDVAAAMRGAGVTAVSVAHDSSVRLKTSPLDAMTPEQRRRQRAERTAREIEAYVAKRAFLREGAD